MNVIIRLQNLPWSANATDIRSFFKNLLIPEGGVHIIGGENGDAFIAFSNDEDARQAMQLSGGRIKEVQVSLQLSSRAEMQKVIEKARSATAAINYLPKPSQTNPTTVMSNQFSKKVEVPATSVPQAPVISMTNYLSQTMQQQQQQQVLPLLGLTQQPPNMVSTYQSVAPTEIPGFGGLGATGVPIVPANYVNYLAMMNPSNLNFINPLSQVNASVVPATNHIVNKDPRTPRVDIHDRDIYRRQRSPERRRSRSRSRERENGTKQRKTRFSAPDEPKIVPNLSVLPPTLVPAVTQYNTPPQTIPMKSSIWENPPPQVFANNYQTENNSSSATSSALGNIGTCVKMANVDNDTHYSDLRKFFSGLPIGNNDIKFVTDQKGNRNGVVLIRFLSSDSKKKALTKSLWQLKSTQVVITSISEDDFDRGMLGSSGNGQRNINRNDRYDDRNDRRNDDRQDDRRRFRDRSNSRERDSRNFNKYDGNNRQNFNFRENSRDNFRNDRNDQFKRNDRFDRNDRNFRNQKHEERQEKPKEYKPDENYRVLVVDDIPRTATESDLFETFPNIETIIVDKVTAYVRFTTHETAKMTLENRFLHYICNKRVFLEAGSDEQFNDMERKFGKVDNPELVPSNANIENDESRKSIENNGSNHFGSREVNNFNEDTNHSTTSRDSRENPDPRNRDPRSRDPRQRNFNNNSNDSNSCNDRFGGQTPNPIRTDCVIIKNMDPGSTIEDVEFFFKDLGINQMRVHILLDKKGDPCGDCFVEFKYPNDSQRATVKNNTMMKNCRVSVLQIPREQVDAVLSSFGNNGNDNGNDDNRGNRGVNRDWAPPSDFGRPGCVLMLSNLSYRASVADILDVLREFNLHPDQLIRRFNDMGQPTGNACINFNSPQDADVALDKYNSVKILGRPVWLRRV